MSHERLVVACKVIGRLTKERLESGQIPQFLGVHGLLALLYDKIRRFNAGYGQKELIEMASDAFVLAMLAMESELTPPPDLSDDSPSPENENCLPDMPIHCPACGRVGPTHKRYIPAPVTVCFECGETLHQSDYEKLVQELEKEQRDAEVASGGVPEGAAVGPQEPPNHVSGGE